MMKGDDLKRKLNFRLAKEKDVFKRKSMHFLERPLAAGTVLRIGPNKHNVKTDSYLVVIDEAPGAYWTHPVSYEFHNVENNGIRIIREQYPLEDNDINAQLEALNIPDLPHLKSEKEGAFLKDLLLDPVKLKERLSFFSFSLSRPCMSNNHALFVAGMDNMTDFHNDFLNMKNVLIECYGYDPANIVLVMGDGSGYPDLPVDYPGTVAGLDEALDTYVPGGIRELGPDDNLFLYTFNHGGFDGTNAYLCMWPSWDDYYDYQLKAKLDNINCGQLVTAMNQCHSGGFLNEVLSTTGPSRIAIMTACREDQSAYPAAIGGHGYFSVVLYTAMNWAFPPSIPSSFAGYQAGTITSQDTNNDGMVCAEEAWQWVHDMMNAHHSQTINGFETPQWGESTPGVGLEMFWGRPKILLEDGSPWWESTDILLLDPAVLPDDNTTAPASPYYWGDNYHPDVPNRIVARVHNSGCAPCRNITVEFRVMSFGAGGELNWWALPISTLLPRTSMHMAMLIGIFPVHITTDALWSGRHAQQIRHRLSERLSRKTHTKHSLIPTRSMLNLEMVER